jgi:3-oxoacyl-[acyl-carrier protein] reductase
MDLGLKDRVAMVAASSSGLGFAAALSLLKEGAAVSICSRTLSRVEEAAVQLRKAVPQGRVLTTVCDVTSGADLIHWHQETKSRLGQVEILVTNTGGPPAGKFLALTEELWRGGIESTLMNVVTLCQAVVPEMQAKKWGRIVHITSLVAKQPLDILTISATLRAGLSALTKTMANQFAADGVLVNALLPGHVLTDRQRHLNEVRGAEAGITPEEVGRQVESTIPLRRYGRTEEIGDVIAFLCSERASYLTGVSLQVDGGVTQSVF